MSESAIETKTTDQSVETIEAYFDRERRALVMEKEDVPMCAYLAGVEDGLRMGLEIKSVKA